MKLCHLQGNTSLVYKVWHQSKKKRVGGPTGSCACVCFFVQLILKQQKTKQNINNRSTLLIMLWLAVIFLLISATGYFFFRVYQQPKPSERLLVTRSSNFIYFVSLSVWPFIFWWLCQSLAIEQSATMAIAFLWPVILLLTRSALLDVHHKCSKAEDHAKYQETRGTAGLMFTAAFGVGILFNAIRGSQDQKGSKLILASLLLCVAFFIPTHMFVSGTAGSRIVNVTQNCVLHIAIGIFMMGIIQSYFSNQNS